MGVFVFKLEPLNSSERKSVLAVSKNLSMDAKPNGGVMNARRQDIYVSASIQPKYLKICLYTERCNNDESIFMTIQSSFHSFYRFEFEVLKNFGLKLSKAIKSTLRRFYIKSVFAWTIVSIEIHQKSTPYEFKCIRNQSQKYVEENRKV